MTIKSNWLVSAVLLDGKGGAKHINETQLRQWSPQKGVLWIHLNLTIPSAINWLKKEAGLDSWAIETLTDTEESRPRVVVHKNSLLLVLRTVNLTPRSEPDDMVFLRLWATKERLITARIHPAISFKEIRDDFENKEGPTDINSLIEVILENTLDSTADTVSDMEDRVDDMEETIISNKNTPTMFDDLSELNRQLVVMHRFLSPERDALDALTRHEAPWFNQNLKRCAKDSFNRMQRIIEDIVLLRERIRINQEVLNQHAAKRSQKNMYMLSVIATIFLPLSFLTGLFGMNVGGIPFSSASYGLFITTALIIFFGFALLFTFKKIGWLD